MEVLGLTRDHLVRVKVGYPEPENGTSARTRDHLVPVGVAFLAVIIHKLPLHVQEFPTGAGDFRCEHSLLVLD